MCKCAVSMTKEHRMRFYAHDPKECGTRNCVCLSVRVIIRSAKSEIK